MKATKNKKLLIKSTTDTRRKKTLPGSAKDASKQKKIQPPRTLRRPKLKSQKSPRSADDLSAMSERAQEQWILTTHVIQKVRTQGVSVTQASKEYGIDRKKVIKLAGPALRKQKNGRYTAKSYDRLLRVLVIPSKDGLAEVAVRDSRTASKIAKYSDAVQRFLRTGDKSRLREFKKLRINDAEGNPIKLLTDPKELTRLGSAGVLSFESLYARVA